jgi:hypothetical protein
MQNHTRILLAAISACPILLGVGCGSSKTTGGTGSGGESAQGGTLGSGGKIAQGGAGGSGGSAAGSGGSGSGGTSRATGGTVSTTPSGGRIGGAGGQTRMGGAGGGGGGSTGGMTGGAGGATGTGRATGGSTGKGGTAGSSTGKKDGGGAPPDAAGAGGNSAGREGFYKEIFMDIGVGLDHLNGLPAADKLGWSWEFVSTDDTEVQHAYMWGDANDDNGVLLYPDREPRFMLIYTGGGYGDHATAVGSTGIKNVQDFFYNGGSYVGTCHGNYLAWNWGYKFWPGQIVVDQYEGYVDGIIPDDSPLLRYYDFGGDHLISKLEHYKGGYESGTLPAGTEVLLIGKSNSNPIDGDGHPTGYAYKPKETSGRVCGLNDHPEYAFQNGEIMNYLQASFRYARDGLAPPDVKAALANGEARAMDKSSGDKDPAHTKIGDKQYHHFTVALPDGAKDLTVTLAADTGYDMNLYLAKDTFALASRASHSDASPGPNKTLTVTSPEPGTWYVGVECATTVTATKTSHGYDYSGNLAVLNGVKYTIKASWTP